MSRYASLLTMTNIVIFLGQVGYSRTWDEMVIFLGRDCNFVRTSWQFHNLGRVGHVLRTRWSPFSKFGKLKILLYAFCDD